MLTFALLSSPFSSFQLSHLLSHSGKSALFSVFSAKSEAKGQSLLSLSLFTCSIVCSTRLSFSLQDTYPFFLLVIVAHYFSSFLHPIYIFALLFLSQFRSLCLISFEKNGRRKKQSYLLSSLIHARNIAMSSPAGRHTIYRQEIASFIASRSLENSQFTS